jgi:predicted nuclease of restriction endonuclease-like (RecB) superfamily
MRSFYLAGQGFGDRSGRGTPKRTDSLDTVERIYRHQGSPGRRRENRRASWLAQAFPLPWSAYVRLLAVKSTEARSFYETEALRGGWSVRQLDRQVGSQFYERTALSRNKAAMLEQGSEATPDDRIAPEEAIKDPFLLEFLDLKDEYSETDLKEALIQRLTDFLLELGDDLLFFHRRLKAPLIVDLLCGVGRHRRRAYHLSVSAVFVDRRAAPRDRHPSTSRDPKLTPMTDRFVASCSELSQ